MVHCKGPLSTKVCSSETLGKHTTTLTNIITSISNGYMCTHYPLSLVFLAKSMLVTLWGHAIDFHENTILDQMDPVIIIFAGVIVRTWESEAAIFNFFIWCLVFT